MDRDNAFAAIIIAILTKKKLKKGNINIGWKRSNFSHENLLGELKIYSPADYKNFFLIIKIPHRFIFIIHTFNLP